jgi:hypothetical protein
MKQSKKPKPWLPEQRDQAQHMAWETVRVFREQLNDSLGCNIKTGELSVVVKLAMQKYDRWKKSQ